MNGLALRGSVADVAALSKTSAAEVLMNVERVVLVDVSASMLRADAQGGRRRYDVAADELAKLQAARPGKIGLVAFASGAKFCLDGRLPEATGSTDLGGALRLAATLPGTPVVVVSDGQPDSEGDALAAAASIDAQIDTVYVGPEFDTYPQQFLKRLSASKGGRHVAADRAHALADHVERLMLAGGSQT
jgi:hypothetical protein